MATLAILEKLKILLQEINEVELTISEVDELNREKDLGEDILIDISIYATMRVADGNLFAMRKLIELSIEETTLKLKNEKSTNETKLQ